jgi:hypothetical protein
MHHACPPVQVHTGRLGLPVPALNSGGERRRPHDGRRRSHSGSRTHRQTVLGGAESRRKTIQKSKSTPITHHPSPIINHHRPMCYPTNNHKSKTVTRILIVLRKRYYIASQQPTQPTPSLLSTYTNIVVRGFGKYCPRIRASRPPGDRTGIPQNSGII